jgi:hypothetical protein
MQMGAPAEDENDRIGGMKPGMGSNSRAPQIPEMAVTASGKTNRSRQRKKRRDRMPFRIKRTAHAANQSPGTAWERFPPGGSSGMDPAGREFKKLAWMDETYYNSNVSNGWEA